MGRVRSIEQGHGRGGWVWHAGGRGFVALVATVISVVGLALPTPAGASAVSNVSFVTAAYPEQSPASFSTITTHPAYANQTSLWQVSFTPATSLGAGDTITATFPTGFVVATSAASIQFSSLTGLTGCSTMSGTATSVAGTSVTITVPSSCSWSSGPVTFELTSGITNPPATDSSYAAGNFTVSTNVDLTSTYANIISLLGPSGTNVSAVSAPGNHLASMTQPWSVAFTTSAANPTTGGGPYGGALVAGDTISVTFPAGFTLPSSTQPITLNQGFTSCTATGSTSSLTETITLAGTGCSLGANTPAVLTIPGIKSPTAGSYSSLSVVTSEDPITVTGTTTTPLTITTPPGTSVTGVAYTATSYAGNATTTWTANFTPTVPGFLTNGDTITLTIPASFALASSTTVTFALGFTGGTYCAPQPVTPSGSTLTVTLAWGCGLNGGTPAALSFSATNPPSTSTYVGGDFAVVTSEDLTPSWPTSVVAIQPSGSQLSSVGFATATYLANATQTWNVSFTTSNTATSSGRLVAGDTVTAQFPAGFTITSPASVTFGGSFSLGCSAGNTGTISGSRVTVALPSGCSLAAGANGEISFSVQNAAAATYPNTSFVAYTSEDTQPAYSTNPVTIASSVSSVGSVAFNVPTTPTGGTYSSGDTAFANQATNWQVSFAPATANPSNVYVTFPVGFNLGTSPAFTLSGGFVCSSTYTGTASLNGPTSVDVAIPSGCTLAAAPTTGTITFTSGITNPPVTDSPSPYSAANFTVSTNVDVQPMLPGSVPNLVPSGTKVTGASAPGTHLAHATEPWTIDFSTSSATISYGGALVAGDTISVTFPAGFTLPSGTQPITLISGFSSSCSATGIASGLTELVTLSGAGCSAPAGTAVSIAIPGITNPIAGAYSIGVITSEDPVTGTTASATVSPAGTAVTGVSFTAVSYAANTATTWSANFTPTAPATLTAGDTVTVTMPSSFPTLGLGSSVTFARGFSGSGCQYAAPVTWTLASSKESATVTVPGGCSLAGGTPARLSFGATNPSATTTYSASQFTIVTSEDPTPVPATSVLGIGASGTAVTGVSFAVALDPGTSGTFSTSNHAYGNQVSFWQVAFTSSSTGGLIPGDAVTVTFPAGFSMSNPTVTFGSNFSGCSTTAPGVASGDTMTVALPSGCSLGAGLSGTLTFEVTNPPATTTYTASQFDVSTSEDLAAVSPQSSSFVTSITPSGSAPTVGTVTDSPSKGNVAATLSIPFTTSTGNATTAASPYGGGLTAGDTITVSVPAGYVITTPTTAVTLSTCGAVTTGSVSGSVGTGWHVTLTLPAGCSIANGNTATVAVSLTNPPADTYNGFKVVTSEDTTAGTSGTSVTLLATGTQVSNVTFGALTYAGNTQTTWTVGFTPSLPGGLAPNDTITITMPSAFFDAAPTQKVTFASGFTGSAACSPVTPTYGATGGVETVVVTLPAGCSLAGGQRATVTIPLTNPPFTFVYSTLEFGVKTSADSVSSVTPGTVHAITPSGSSVNTVTFGTPTNAGNQAATWTVGFTTSAVGSPVGSYGGALVAGDTITVGFPAGFVITSSPAVSLSGCGVLSPVGVTGSVGTGWTVTSTLPVGCSVGASAPVTVTVALVNPPVTDHYSAGQFAVSTTEDPGLVSPATVSPIVASGSTVGAVSFAGVTNNMANVTETWKVGFTTSAVGTPPPYGGALVAGDTITTIFPSSFGLVANPTIGLGAAFGVGCTATGSVVGHTLTVTLAGTCKLPPNTAATFTVSSVTNPPAGTYATDLFGVSTSEDATSPVPPSSSVIITPTGGQVTAVTFTAGTYAGNTSTTWTAGFTATPGGDLFPGDTVTVTFPTSGSTSDFLITPTPTVNFTSGFTAGFLGCNPTVGSFIAGTLKVVLPANCTLAAGVSASIAVTAVNPPVTTTYLASQFTVATNEDQTPKSPATVHAIVPSGTVVNGVTFHGSTYKGNQNTTWTVTFNASSVGTPPPYGGALVAGDTVTVGFPAGFVIAPSPVVSSSICGALTSGVVAGSVGTGWTVTLTLPSGCSLATGASATVTVAVTNPPVTDHVSAGQYTVMTSEDPGLVSPATVSPIVASGTTVGSVSFTAGTYRANQATTWTATFKSSNLGGLVAGDTVTIGLPTSIVLVQPYAVTLGSFTGAGSCTLTSSDLSVSPGSVVVTVPVGCSLANGTLATVALSTVNPPITVPAWTTANFSVSTSEDPAVVPPSSVSPLIQSGSTVSNVTFAATDYSGNRTVFWTASFTTSNASPIVGGLVGGDTITVVYPSAFQIAAASTVQLSGFAGSCVLPPADVSVVAATISIIVPSGCTLANGATGSVLVSMINPPSTVRYLVGQFSVQTSEDPTVVNPVAVAPLVPSGPGVVPTSVTVTGYPNASNTATLWSIGFTPSATGKLVAGDAVMVVFPATVIIASSTSVTLTGGFTGCSTVGASYFSHTLFFVLPIGCSLAASTPATFTVTSTSPIATGTYAPSAFLLSTTEDLVAASPTTIVVGSATSGSASSTGATSTSIPAPPPAGIAPSSLGVPQSVILGTTAASVVLVSGSSIFEVTVPASSLPAGTTLSLYPVTTTTAATSQLPPGSVFVAALAVSWQTAGGSSPAAGSPLTMTVSNPSIVAGDVIYIMTPSGLQQVGVATSNDMATVNFINDPVFIVAKVSQQVQATLNVSNANATVGRSISLTTTGGSGSGAVSFVVTGGTASGCVISGATLSASGPGTCVVVASKAGDATYASATAQPATVTFRALVHAKPPVVTLTFVQTAGVLTPAMRASIAVLAHKLVRGASVVVQTFAFHNLRLAQMRAVAVRKFLLSRVVVHVALRFVTSSQANVARLITTKQ